MRRLSYLVLTLAALFLSTPCPAYGGPELVEDKPGAIEALKRAFTKADNFLNEIQTKKAQLEEILKSNSTVEALYKAGNKIALYSTAMRDFISTTETMYRVVSDDRQFIMEALNSGMITPYEASRMLDNLERTLEACAREIKFIDEVVLKQDNNMTGQEQREAIEQSGDNIRGMQEDLETEMRDVKIRNDGKKVMAMAVDGLTQGFFGKPTEAQKTKIENEVKNTIAKNRLFEKEDTEPIGVEKNTLHRLAIILMGIVLMVYVPYNIYKYNKGEQQAKDALLKIFVAMVFGPLLLFLFGFIFKV